MWLVINNEGVKFLCATLDHVQSLIAVDTDYIWTVEKIPIYNQPIESPVVNLNLETGRVEKKKPHVSAVPLHRSGDTE